MKFIRKNNAILEMLQVTLRSKNKASFTLFPMIHVGDAAFFETVARQANAHDLVLCEGVRGAAGRSANLAYRAATLGHSQLKFQNREMRRALTGDASGGGGTKWVNSDMNPEEFRAKWKKVPFWQRMLVRVALPILAIALRFRKLRHSLLDNLSESDPQADKNVAPELFDLLVQERDAVLLKNCEQVMDAAVGQRVAVIWGAHHMPALIQALIHTHGYRITSRKWVPAMTVSDPETRPAHSLANTAAPSDHRG